MIHEGQEMGEAMRSTARTERAKRGPTSGRLAVWAVLLALLGPVAARAQVPANVVRQAITNACEHPPDPASEAVVAGVVTDSVSGVRLPKVQMTLTWRGKADTVPTRQVKTTGSDGFFVFCGVPAGVSVSLVARARMTRGPFTWQIEPGQLYMQNILLPLSTTEAKGVLIGQVIDADTQRPVVDATVRLVERERTTETNTHGFFTFGTQPFGVYTLEVSRLGYADYAAPVRVAGDFQQSVQVKISKRALKLEGLRVTVRAPRRRIDMNGLVQRMNLGLGTFITADQLDTRPMARLPELLRGMTGFWVDVNQRDHTFSLEVDGHPCSPNVFIDGIRYRGPLDGLEFPPAEDLEAVEVYKGAEIPGVFMSAGLRECAAIAIWTRMASGTGGRE
jgi:hypothetical protein